jgi:hypothetical protein
MQHAAGAGLREHHDVENLFALRHLLGRLVQLPEHHHDVQRGLPSRSLLGESVRRRHVQHASSSLVLRCVHAAHLFHDRDLQQWFLLVPAARPDVHLGLQRRERHVQAEPLRGHHVQHTSRSVVPQHDDAA